MRNSSKCGVEIADVLHQGGRFGFLLVHRLGGSPDDLGYVSDGLAQAGYTVSCPLLYGHGGTPELLAATTWQQWLDSLVEAHRLLASRCDLIVLGGLGVGALLALAAATGSRARIDGLALLAPTLWPDGWAVPWYAHALRFLDSKRLANLVRLDERPPYGIKDETLRREWLAALACDHHRSAADVMGRLGGALLEVKWLAQHVSERLGQVRQPCVIFHPRHDDRSALTSSQELQRRLGGLVDLIVLDDSYHLVTRDRQRALVLERLLEFAEGLPARVAQGT